MGRVSIGMRGLGLTQEIGIHEEVRRADTECHSSRWVEEGTHARVAQHEVSESKHDEVIPVEGQLNSRYRQGREEGYVCRGTPAKVIMLEQ